MISIIIPAYNEDKSINKLIKNIKKELDKDNNLRKAEIIIVDDGSTDNTKKYAELLNVKVLSNPTNMGYGYSLKKGILAAKYDTIVIIDADLTYPFSYISKLYEMKKQGIDLVIGARNGKYYKETVIKNILRKCLKYFAEFMTCKKIKDINSGFRIFDKHTVINYFPRLCNTFSFTTSQTISYIMNSLTIGYIDIPYYKRNGNSKVRIIRDSFITLKYIIKNCLYYRPTKIFSLLGLFCFISIIIYILLKII